MSKCNITDDIHYCQVGWETCACGKYTYKEMTGGMKAYLEIRDGLTNKQVQKLVDMNEHVVGIADPDKDGLDSRKRTYCNGFEVYATVEEIKEILEAL